VRRHFSNTFGKISVDYRDDRFARQGYWLCDPEYGRTGRDANRRRLAAREIWQAVPSSGALKRCPQVVDGAGELTNIIVGGINSQLTATHWAFNFLTTPTIIIG